MRLLGEFLMLIGGLILMFSSIITFGFDFGDDTENIIFYRGILIASFLIYCGSAIIIKNDTIKNVMISLGSGVFGLIVISTFNLVFDDLVNVDYYFFNAIIVVSITLIIITIMKIWSIKRMKYLRS